MATVTGYQSDEWIKELKKKYLGSWKRKEKNGIIKEKRDKIVNGKSNSD